MKAFVKSNTYNPGLVEMDDMVGQVCELTGHVDGDSYVVQQPNSYRDWWFFVDDLVMEDSPDFGDWVSGKITTSTPQEQTEITERWHKDHEFVTISRSTLQSFQSQLKQEIRNSLGITQAFKDDAKYFASIGDKDRAKQYYKNHDKFRERTRSLEKRMKEVKKALT